MALTAALRRLAWGQPPARLETRAAGDFTDQILAGSYAAATGRVHAASVAGVQAAAGIVGRALASATIENDGGAVDPHLLEGIGTDLVRAGRFLGRLTVGPVGRGADSPRVLGAVCRLRDQRPRIVGLFVTGKRTQLGAYGARHSRRSRQRPNQQRLLPAVGRYRAARPGGRQSGQLAARLASSLGDEADIVVSRIIPIAQGSGETAANQLSKAISGALPGRLAFPETQLAGAGAGRSSAPMRDFGATRTGWESPPSGPTLYAHLCSPKLRKCAASRPRS